MEPTYPPPTHPSRGEAHRAQIGNKRCASSVSSVLRFQAEIRPPIDSHTVHQLRHTFATKMLKEGMTLNDVRLLHGHSSIQATQRYQHLESSDASPKAAAILNKQNVARSRARIKSV
jgi:site-specific recombinase XerC